MALLLYFDLVTSTITPIMCCQIINEISKFEQQVNILISANLREELKVIQLHQ